MSTKINKHGVHISKVSSVYESFTKASCIPADDITPAMAADWARQRAESGMDGLVPIDLQNAGCWLTWKMRASGFSEEQISASCQFVGRSAIGGFNTCWSVATKLYEASCKEKARLETAAAAAAAAASAAASVSATPAKQKQQSALSVAKPQELEKKKKEKELATTPPQQSATTSSTKSKRKLESDAPMCLLCDEKPARPVGVCVDCLKEQRMRVLEK